MSIYKSYFNKSNTLLYNSYTNTARNPVVELFYGRLTNIGVPYGFSRYIFDIDLTKLQQKISDKTISVDCNGYSGLTHTLRMTNTSSFDEELLNDKTSQGRRRATSFDLILYRIPKTSGSTGTPQTWDSGVGYDYYNYGITNLNDRSFSERPTNWFERSTIDSWSTDGIYNNTNSLSGGVNYSAITIIDTQHFEFGNEDIEFDMTNEINSILSGGTTGVTGWGISFLPQVENISGLTENYSVGFFSPQTQTFYEPFLETSYDDLIIDSRSSFHADFNNSLYLYIYDNGSPVNLDTNPTVDILDADGEIVGSFSSLTTCNVTKGVYKVDVNGLNPTSVPCLYYDVWKGLSIGGVSLSDHENEFAILEKTNRYQIGTTTQEPKIYGFSFDGIKQSEKVLNSDIRKVNVTIKQAYSSNSVLGNVKAYYRIYIREGINTEVQVQDWTRINKTNDGYYFIFDTTDKIPNEYFVDIKVESERNIDTYKREIQFQIVNKK
jgi:hypothetical protein